MKHFTSSALIITAVGLSAAPASAALAPVAVPDMASTAALLGVGVLGLFGLRRWMNRR
jgi:hypothetical protein